MLTFKQKLVKAECCPVCDYLGSKILIALGYAFLEDWYYNFKTNLYVDLFLKN